MKSKDRVVLEIRGISKKLCLHPGMAPIYAFRDIFRALGRARESTRLSKWEFWALRNVSLEVKAGEVLGVIGHNGAGKTTLLNLSAGIYRPTEGSVHLNTDRAVVMDYQVGSSRLQTGTDNIRNRLALHGFSRREIEKAMKEIVEYSGLGEFIDTPVGLYSLGMKFRLNLSIYAHLRPGIFFVDEALGGGDIHFRNRFLRFVQDYIAGGGAMLFVSHDLFTVQAICSRCVLLDRGKLVMVGDAAEVIHAYVNPEYRTEPDASDEAPIRHSLASREDPTMDPPDSGDHYRHSGNLPVRVESIRISALDGSTPVCGGAVRFHMLCYCQENISRVIWGIQIGRPDLFPLATMHGGYDGRMYNLKPGWNEFVCTVDKLPLLPGRYQMHSALANATSGEVLGMMGFGDTHPGWFDVTGYPDPALNIEILEKGLIHIPVTWEENA